MTKLLKNIIVIGCGPHFRERYYEVLAKVYKQNNLCLKLVVDLVSEEGKIKNFFRNKEVFPEKYLFLSDENRNFVDVKYFEKLINKTININEIDGVIISTEPKAHKNYAIWAAKNRLDIFSDKPLSAFQSYDQMDSLYTDYLEIIKYIEENNVNFVLSCERRGHLGYKYLKQYISNIIHKHRVPITFVDVHFGGGKWIMPDEYFYLENHPFKYGYGVLLHSGYHYIDLLMTLISLNSPIVPLSMSDIELYTISNNPYNLFNILSNHLYLNLLNTNRFADYFDCKSVNNMKYFGETDLMAIGRFKNGKDVITNFSLKLMETSVSKRSSHEPPEDTYLLIGKMRQENLIIHLGHLCSIHVRSNPYTKMTNDATKIEDFSIDIISNASLLGNEPVVKIKRSDLSEIFPDLLITDKLNIKARQWQLMDFLNGGDGNSPLVSHNYSIMLLDLIYKQIKNNNSHIDLLAESNQFDACKTPNSLNEEIV